RRTTTMCGHQCRQPYSTQRVKPLPSCQPRFGKTSPPGGKNEGVSSPDRVRPFRSTSPRIDVQSRDPCWRRHRCEDLGTESEDEMNLKRLPDAVLVLMAAVAILLVATLGLLVFRAGGTSGLRSGDFDSQTPVQARTAYDHLEKFQALAEE